MLKIWEKIAPKSTFHSKIVANKSEDSSKAFGKENKIKIVGLPLKIVKFKKQEKETL